MHPSARTAIPREAWSAIAVVAIAGNTFPAVFFPLAQQRVESSVAGMMNSVGPILTVLTVGLYTHAQEQQALSRQRAAETFEDDAVIGAVEVSG